MQIMYETLKKNTSTQFVIHQDSITVTVCYSLGLHYCYSYSLLFFLQRIEFSQIMYLYICLLLIIQLSNSLSKASAISKPTFQTNTILHTNKENNLIFHTNHITPKPQLPSIQHLKHSDFNKLPCFSPTMLLQKLPKLVIKLFVSRKTNQAGKRFGFVTIHSNLSDKTLLEYLNDI